MWLDHLLSREEFGRASELKKKADISKVEAYEVIQLTIVHCIMEAELISCL